MNNRSFAIYAGLFLLLVAVQVAILLNLDRGGPVASVVCRATNGGIRLRSGDVEVSVFPAFQREQLAAEGQLDRAIELAPGRYDIRLFFNRSQDQQTVWIEDVNLPAGQQSVREVEFEVGEISVAATVGDGPAAPDEVVVYVMSAGNQDDIITSMSSGEKALIGSGNYDLRVVLLEGAEEKDAVWLCDRTVKAGIHTVEDVVFRRGFLKVDVTNAGQDLSGESVTVTVYRAGDQQREIVDTAQGGAAFGLAQGNYDVKVTFSGSDDKPVRWLRDLEIKENKSVEERVDFSSGTVVTRAAIRNGEEVGPFEVYVYYYRADDHQQPVVYTTAGRPVTLQSGHYDVRASFFRSNDQPDIWLRDLQLKPGKTARRTLYFPSGKLLVRAYDRTGTELVGDNVFVYVYGSKDRKRPITSARSGELIVLTEGSYDIRAEDTRGTSKKIWLSDVRLSAGRVTEKSISLDDPNVSRRFQESDPNVDPGRR